MLYKINKRVSLDKFEEVLIKHHYNVKPNHWEFIRQSLSIIKNDGYFLDFHRFIKLKESLASNRDFIDKIDIGKIDVGDEDHHSVGFK